MGESLRYRCRVPSQQKTEAKDKLYAPWRSGLVINGDCAVRTTGGGTRKGRGSSCDLPPEWLVEVAGEAEATVTADDVGIAIAEEDLEALREGGIETGPRLDSILERYPIDLLDVWISAAAVFWLWLQPFRSGTSTAKARAGRTNV